AKVEFFVDDEIVFADGEPPWQVVYDFGTKPGVHVVRVVAHHRDGPTVSDFVITKSLKPQYVINVQRVVLDVSVRDGKNRLVTGLQAEDFSVFEDDRPQELLAVGLDERPLLVGILLDSSGSMRGERIEQAQEAACEFVETLRPEDRAFVIDFDEQVFLIQQTTHDHEDLCLSTRSTQAIGGTSIYDALHAAYRVIHQADAERRALVVLTDGDDSSSTLKFDDLLLEAKLADVTVYVIGLDVGAISDGRRTMTRLSDTTGGRSFFVKRARDLVGTYEAIAEELRSLYQLVYSSDNDTMDGRFIEIDVKLTGGERHDVRHRSGYFAVED
ncbi:MAG: VWA domain-containing protein, partial [Acidobacteriota bacterium]|nr:VWA domain-containing protein [Acidobacteriota bacterium]